MEGFKLTEERAYKILFGMVTHTGNEYGEALRMGACLLRRMVPRPPEVPVWEGDKAYIVKCPYCTETIIDPTGKPPRAYPDGAKHCPYCGGAIDFSNVSREKYQEMREMNG